MIDDLSLYREEFTLGHGNEACLLVHGLGCGPIQMRELAEDLCKWGFTSRGILLPGHCGDTEGLALSTLHDWKKKVEIEYDQLKKRHKEVVVIGFSLGALLTLQMALDHPIEKIILMGTPLFLIREYLPINTLIGVCKIFLKSVRTRKRRCYIESEMHTEYLYQPINSHYPLQTLHEIKQLIKVIKPPLKEIKSAALVIHSKKDLIAAPASARYVMKHLGSHNKRLVWLERSHHLIMFDVEKEVVFNAIKEFLL
ncbi:MAG: alpha/beta fold hydrolase [Candidatus Brocadia sp.]|nr:alpha/beta fold hydrolase [Candidatus Brocadia sp.]